MARAGLTGLRLSPSGPVTPVPSVQPAEAPQAGTQEGQSVAGAMIGWETPPKQRSGRPRGMGR